MLTAIYHIMVSIVNKLFKSFGSNSLKKYDSFVNNVNYLEEEISKLDDLDLRQKTQFFKEKLSNGVIIDKILPEVFAVVREAAKRTVNMRHFDVQLIGGKVLHDGKIAEMKTGEGKTLVATLAAYANSLTGKSVHIVTVNDYLAKRDSIWMGELYKFLGLSVGCITSTLDHQSRPEQYNCDIVYATNNEIGFDFLRDNLKNDYETLCFKKEAFAIIDEVDSILIDEARTPLVISAESNSNTELYPKINKIIKFLGDDDYEINEEGKSILLTTKGMDFTENLLKKNNLITKGTLQDIENISLNHNIIQALRAHKLFNRDKDYIIKNKDIVIIDELTGRPMEGRRFGDGLHQAIEAKENLVIQKENQTIASITYQNFFRTYAKLCGMTGTALTEAKEFEGIYNLEVVDIPPNIKINRLDKNDQIYMTKKEKYNAVLDLVKNRNEMKQPILIGTTSVENSEIISKLLLRENINHKVLNAKNHKEEAEIILQAGIPGNVTISTNMAGRGTDIKLGNDNDELKNNAINSGGLLVIGTERHESRRIDNQLRGRAGRQGDIGESIFFLSLEDDLMRIFGSESINKILEKLGLKDGESIDHPWINKALERAQQKVEARNFDIRKTLIKFDNVLNDQRHVIFTQRNNAMNSEEIFNYSENFLNEIIDDLIKLKIQKISNPKSNEFNNRIKTLMGKNINESQFQELALSNDENIKQNIIKQFNENRKERVKILGESQAKEIEKRIFLQSIDLNWRSHIQYLEQLRQVIGLRSYGQRDPLIEYKKEAFNLFSILLEKLKLDYITVLMNLRVVEQPVEKSKDQIEKKDYSKIPEKKMRRNEPCYCGSGKKYKHCCGAL